ncbi:hypothetical protein COV15_02220 [Candidatus Woesearchaeota archaeon CG10_big_fil_rev_8_21_14_0_10_34_12]|nr:MAG: hypothetical protein COV15_02220 [Candidatus Woesearchaeota archaeon CG10_big_fil_rev_8_21_14_0_10_34_12]
MGIFDKFKKVFENKNTLYFPGCLTKYKLKEVMENYKKILGIMKIDFITLPTEFCCGSPVLASGYDKDARELARKNFKLFKEHNIGKIITNCPACYKTFKDYKEMLPEWDIEVEHIITTMLDYLGKKGNKKISINLKNQRITYHDPCYLGRYSGFYEEPRKILRLLGYEVIEMKHNKKEALCCGGGGGLRANNPKLASEIAKKIFKEAENLKINKIVSTCPLCFIHISENSEIEVEEFSKALLNVLELK